MAAVIALLGAATTFGARNGQAAPVIMTLPIATVAASQAATPFSYQDYAQTLKTYVDDRGMVNYRRLKAKPQSLNAFKRSLSRLDRKVYNSWTDAQKIAFWINAYNGLTLAAIIDHYPIKSRWLASLTYPKNSIRQIKGVWDTLTFTVMGRKVTLEEIEHKILRGRFNEPGIHMALVCAAMSCPQLRNEPFEADRLKEQFADQAKKFIGGRLRFRMDRAKRIVYLSPILDWFGDDFVKRYTPPSGFAGFNKAQRATLYYVSLHLNKANAAFLKNQKYKIKYLDYDWSLNEQKPKKK